MDYQRLEYYDYTNVTDFERVVATLGKQLKDIDIPNKWINGTKYGVERHHLVAPLRNTEMKTILFEFHHHGSYYRSLMSLFLLVSHSLITPSFQMVFLALSKPFPHSMI